MTREVPKTLFSLSRDFQLDCDGITWEIILVDNGSMELPIIPDMKPTPRILKASSSSASPVLAVNQAISLASADIIGAWIDGARLASANLISAVYHAKSLHESPIIAVPNRQLGMMRQSSAAELGYCQEYEDKLLLSAGWPSKETDLDSISWPEEPSITSPMLESNALFLTKKTWTTLKGYDPQFSESGGGMCNPDVFQRAIDLQSTQLIRMRNVATYHQYHCGTSTSNEAQTLNMVKSASREFARLRGYPPRKQKQIGWIYDCATDMINYGDII
jgi:hypothetical protein